MINYTEGIFTREFINGNKKYYATFHPEVIAERESYDSTGRFLVLPLHPEKGLQAFFLNKNDKTQRWELNEGDPAIVEDDILQWCNQQISPPGH